MCLKDKPRTHVCTHTSHTRRHMPVHTHRNFQKGPKAFLVVRLLLDPFPQVPSVWRTDRELKVTESAFSKSKL